MVDDITKPIYETNPDGSFKLDDEGEKIISGYEQKSETTGSATLCVKQGSADGSETTSKAANFFGSIRSGSMGGIAYTAKGTVAATVSLTQIKAVPRSAFDSEAMTVTVAGVEWPVSKEVQCYNKSTKTWFAPGEDGMEAARGYADTLDLYYDRPADEGGKIRMIVVP